MLAKLATAALGLAAATIAFPGTAGAAADTTAPSLRVTPPVFTTGSTIGTSDMRSGLTENSYTKDIASTLSWSASDASGICGYDVKRDYWGMGSQTLLKGTSTLALNQALTDYDGTFGGGSVVVKGWTVTAHDCAGNTRTVSITNKVDVLQEDGQSASAWNTPEFAWTGTWASANCNCASGGTVRQTSTKGASVNLGWNYAKDGSLGVVMPKGPARGKAQVYLDGQLKATVDTHATVNTNRVVVYSTAVKAGFHNVKVVNLASGGQGRIDLDAFLVN
jgi:hypothetical protein